MSSPDLCALIPVHKQDPNIKKNNGWKMPARNLFKQLAKRTHNRVLQTDGVNPASCNPLVDPARKAWEAIDITPATDDLFIELRIEG